MSWTPFQSLNRLSMMMMSTHFLVLVVLCLQVCAADPQVEIDRNDIRDIQCRRRTIVHIPEGKMISMKTGSNYGRARYLPNQTCRWHLYPQVYGQCQVSVICPCFDVHETRSCARDVFIMYDIFSLRQGYCGRSGPHEVSTSRHHTGRMKLIFRSTSEGEPGWGVMCYATCGSPGTRISRESFPRATCAGEEVKTEETIKEATTTEPVPVPAPAEARSFRFGSSGRSLGSSGRSSRIRFE